MSDDGFMWGNDKCVVDVTPKENLITDLASLSCFNSIEDIEDRSDEYTRRALVKFKNGFSLSVIQGPYTYGGKNGLFEIAPLTPDGDWAPFLLDTEDRDDDVLGYCSTDKVKYYLDKVGTHNTTKEGNNAE